MKTRLLTLAVLIVVDRALKALVMASEPIRISSRFVLAPFINYHPMAGVPLPDSVGWVMVAIMPITHLATLSLLVALMLKFGYGPKHVAGWSLLSVGYVSNAVDCWLYAGVVDPVTLAVGGGWWLGVNIADLYIAAGCSVLAAVAISGLWARCMQCDGLVIFERAYERRMLAVRISSEIAIYGEWAKRGQCAKECL